MTSLYANKSNVTDSLNGSLNTHDDIINTEWVIHCMIVGQFAIISPMDNITGLHYCIHILREYHWKLSIGICHLFNGQWENKATPCGPIQYNTSNSFLVLWIDMTGDLESECSLNHSHITWSKNTDWRYIQMINRVSQSNAALYLLYHYHIFSKQDLEVW